MAAIPPAAQSSILPKGSIDGSATPELIADNVAYRLYFSAVGERHAAAAFVQSSDSGRNALLPSTGISRRQRAKLIALQLPDADQAVLVETLADFKSRAFEISHPSSPRSQPAAYKNPEIASAVSLNDATDATVLILQRKMTAASFQHLHDYVQTQKKYMKQIPYPEMKEK